MEASEIVPLLAASDIPWSEIISGLVAIALAWIGFQQVRFKHQQDMANLKLDGIAKVGEASYIFANHAMGEQKKLAAIALRTVAEVKPTEANIKAANAADEAYKSHQQGQAAVDANNLIRDASVRAKQLLDAAKLDAVELLKGAAENNKELADKVAARVVEKVAEKSAEKISEVGLSEPRVEKETTVIQSIAKEISKTHDIEGTVKLTPKEQEKGGA